MISKQLHYLDTLKIALQYLKINTNSMDNFQLVKIYQQIQKAEFKGLSKKYKIDNLTTQGVALSQKYKWLKLSSDTNQPILVTFDPYFEYTFSFLLAEHESAHRFLKHIKHSSIDFWVDIVSFIAIALFLFVYGLVVSSTAVGLCSWLFDIIIIVCGILNAMRLHDESMSNINDHLTTKNELEDIIQNIYDKYKSIVGQPLITEKHLRTIKKNKSSWADLEKRLVKQRRQAKIDA